MSSYPIEDLFLYGLEEVARPTAPGGETWSLLWLRGGNAFALYRRGYSGPGAVVWAKHGDCLTPREDCAYACVRALYQRGWWAGEYEDDEPNFEGLIEFLTVLLGRPPALEVRGDRIVGSAEEVLAAAGEALIGPEGASAPLPEYLRGVLIKEESAA